MIKSQLTPPTVDQATVDHYVARGRRLRSHAFGEAFAALFALFRTERKTAATVRSAHIPA